MKSLAILFFAPLIGMLLMVRSCPLRGQTLHEAIQKTYNFQPHTLTKKQWAEKGPLLDDFWEKISADKNKYLNELRRELQDTTNPTFFYYDCGHLFLKLVKSQEDFQLIYNAMLRTDLADISASEYINVMNFFANKGINTTQAAMKMIALTSAPSFPGTAKGATPFIEEQFQALLYILLPIPVQDYLPVLRKQLPAITDTITTKNILHFLNYTCTCEADSIIAAFSQGHDHPVAVSNYATLIAKNNLAQPHKNHPNEYKLIIKERHEILSRINDETMLELTDLTRRLKRNYACH